MFTQSRDTALAPAPGSLSRSRVNNRSYGFISTWNIRFRFAIGDSSHSDGYSCMGTRFVVPLPPGFGLRHAHGPRQPPVLTLL